MSHDLKMSVIAEGVETKEQVEQLCQMGCDEIQGYYFSRPVDVNGIAQLLSENTQLC